MKCDGPFPHARGSACCCGTACLGSNRKSAKRCKLITRLHRVEYYFRVARGFRGYNKETLLPRRAGARGAGACEGEGRANSGGVPGRKLHLRRAPHDRAPAAGKGRPALHTKVRHTFSCSPDTCSCWGYYGRPALHLNVRRLYTCHVTTAVCMHAQAPAVHHLLTAQRAAYLLAVYCPVYYKFSNLPFPLSRTVLDLLTCIQRLWYSNVCTRLLEDQAGGASKAY